MKKSVFTRYLTVFTVIIFFTFSILALIIGSNLAYSTVNEKRRMVAQTSTTAAGVIQSVIAPETADGAAEKLLGSDFSLKEYLTLMSDYDSDMIVFVTDVNGNVIISDSGIAEGTFVSAIPEKIM